MQFAQKSNMKIPVHSQENSIILTVGKGLYVGSEAANEAAIHQLWCVLVFVKIYSARKSQVLSESVQAIDYFPPHFL